MAKYKLKFLLVIILPRFSGHAYPPGALRLCLTDPFLCRRGSDNDE